MKKSIRNAPIPTPSTPDFTNLDDLIIWRMNDPRYYGVLTEDQRKGLVMQRQWTIEARADFADREKNDAVTQLFRQTAVYLHTALVMIQDGQEPSIACFSDDFMDGTAEIKLHGQELGDTLRLHGARLMMEPSASVSQELLDLAAEVTGDQNKPK